MMTMTEITGIIQIIMAIKVTENSDTKNTLVGKITLLTVIIMMIAKMITIMT